MGFLDIVRITRNFKGLTALSSVDVEVREGEILGIIGPNGAGKTTLFNIVSGFLKPSSGKVLYRGEDLAGLKPHAIVRKGIGRTFQGASLFQGTSCLGNLIIAHQLHQTVGFWQAMLNTKAYRRRESEVVRRSREILAELKLSDRMGLPVHDIPYGHQKMLGLAMILATGARVLLLDEPVAGMNPQEASAIIERVRRLRDEEGKTIVIVEHNMKVVMGICDRIVVLDHGIKIAEGPPSAIQNDPQVIEAYLGTEEG